MIRLQSRFCFKSEHVFVGHTYWVNKVYFLHEYLFSLLPAEISFSTSTSHITHQTSDIKHRTSNIRHPTPDIKHQTSVTPHRTPNIRHPTSHIFRYINFIASGSQRIGFSWAILKLQAREGAAARRPKVASSKIGVASRIPLKNTLKWSKRSS